MKNNERRTHLSLIAGAVSEVDEFNVGGTVAGEEGKATRVDEVALRYRQPS